MPFYLDRFGNVCHSRILKKYILEWQRSSTRPVALGHLDHYGWVAGIQSCDAIYQHRSIENTFAAREPNAIYYRVSIMILPTLVCARCRRIPY
jgi:hypothetical protein